MSNPSLALSTLENVAGELDDFVTEHGSSAMTEAALQLRAEAAVAAGVGELRGDVGLATTQPEPSGRPIAVGDLAMTVDLTLRALRHARSDRV
jgi:hypothetical protein